MGTIETRKACTHFTMPNYFVRNCMFHDPEFELFTPVLRADLGHMRHDNLAGLTVTGRFGCRVEAQQPESQIPTFFLHRLPRLRCWSGLKVLTG